MKFSFTVAVTTILCILLAVTTTNAQNLSALMDAINKMEKKLESLINKESAERKAADAQLKRSIAAKKGGGATTIVKQDTALANAVASLKESLEKTQTNQADLTKQFGEITKRLEVLQSKGGDERVQEMAVELQNLINELKAAINMKDEDKADEVEEKEAMEVGGLVAINLEAQTDEMERTYANVRKVALSANINIAEGVIASITLQAERNLKEISIHDALVAFSPEGKPFSLLFGQQAYNNGLLSTHLISDPLIKKFVEVRGPGIVTNFSAGNFSPGIGVTFFRNNPVTETVYTLNLADSTITASEVVTQEEKNRFVGVFNVDAGFAKESKARVSMLVYGDVVTLDLGLGLVLGPVTLDLEGFTELTDDDEAKSSGYYTGLAYGITDKIEAALRYDGSSVDMFSDLTHRIGAGATFGFKYGIFFALEYGYTKPYEEDGANEIALQFGLQNTLKLPGFQRKTLTQK